MSGTEKNSELTNNQRNRDESAFLGQPMDIRLPSPVSALLADASYQLENLGNHIQSAEDPQQIKQLLQQLEQIRELQKAAIKGILAFHEVTLSQALSSYDARIDTIQGKIIADDTLPEEAKSAKLTDSANQLKSDTYAITHVKHAVHEFQAQIQNLSTARETISDSIDRLTVDLGNAPAQPDKLPVEKAYVTELLQAEKCLFTIIQNELGRGHYNIASAYNSKDSGQSRPQPTTSYYQSNHFQVPPLTHSLLEESKAYIEKANKLDQQYHLTASTLLSHAETTLHGQKTSVNHLGKSGELHFKEFQSNTKSILFNGIKRISQLCTNLKNTQSSLVQHTPEFTAAIVSVLRAVYALEKVGNYANDLQASDAREHVLTRQKQRTMQQLISHYKAALMDSEQITSAAIMYQPANQNKRPLNVVVSTGKKCVEALTNFLSTLFAKNRTAHILQQEQQNMAHIEAEMHGQTHFVHRQNALSGPIVPNLTMQELFQEAANPLKEHIHREQQTTTATSNQNVQPHTHSGRIRLAREQKKSIPNTLQR